MHIHRPGGNGRADWPDKITGFVGLRLRTTCQRLGKKKKTNGEGRKEGGGEGGSATEQEAMAQSGGGGE